MLVRDKGVTLVFLRRGHIDQTVQYCSAIQLPQYIASIATCALISYGMYSGSWSGSL